MIVAKLALAALVCATGASEKTDDGRTRLLTVHGVVAWKDAGPPPAVVFRTGMAIDVDGAPHAYHPQDKQALSHVALAGRPGHWWSVVAKNGQPVVQGPKDLAPGYYVSMTSLQNSAYAETDPRRYMDATKIPYIALPKALAAAGSISIGDLVALVNPTNGKVAYAVYADQGPKDKLGEGSVYLANQLRDKPLPDFQGVRHSLNNIVYVIFPGSGNGRPKSREEIARVGASLFKEWGGPSKAKAIFSD